MTQEQIFPLADVLSVVTGRLLCPIDRVYTLLNFLIGADIYTHQIPTAMRQVFPALVRQYPFLTAAPLTAAVGRLDGHLSSTGDTAERLQICKTWVAAQEVRYGPHLLLQRIPGLSEDFSTPIADLIEKVGPEKIILAEKMSDADGHP